jgi:hypothetical protein
VRIYRQIQDALPNPGPPPMDKIRQVGHPDGIDLLAGKKDVEN